MNTKSIWNGCLNAQDYETYQWPFFVFSFIVFLCAFAAIVVSFLIFYYCLFMILTLLRLIYEPVKLVFTLVPPFFQMFRCLYPALNVFLSSHIHIGYYFACFNFMLLTRTVQATNYYFCCCFRRRRHHNHRHIR